MIPSKKYNNSVKASGFLFLCLYLATGYYPLLLLYSCNHGKYRKKLLNFFFLSLSLKVAFIKREPEEIGYDELDQTVRRKERKLGRQLEPTQLWMDYRILLNNQALCFSFSCKESLGQTCIGRVRPNILWDADIAGAKPRCNQCVESLSFLSVQLIIDPKNKTFPGPKCCPNNGVQRREAINYF